MVSVIPEATVCNARFIVRFVCAVMQKLLITKSHLNRRNNSGPGASGIPLYVEVLLKLLAAGLRVRVGIKTSPYSPIQLKFWRYT